MDGNRIRQVRQQAGMTIARLAEAIDRCEGSVSLYERGKRDIPLSVLHSIARALQVAPSTLVNDEVDVLP